MQEGLGKQSELHMDTLFGMILYAAYVRESNLEFERRERDYGVVYVYWQFLTTDGLLVSFFLG